MVEQKYDVELLDHSRTVYQGTRVVTYCLLCAVSFRKEKKNHICDALLRIV